MMRAQKSRRVRVAVAVATLVAMAAVAVPYAQRRYGGYRGDYSGNVKYDGRFTFVRMSYDMGLRGFGRFRGAQEPWAHDWPDAELNFLKILTSIANVPAHVDETSIMAFDDPELFKFPVIYLVEPGYWYMTDRQVETLRHYLLKGGFLIVDDFPRQQWANFDLQMSRVFPEGQWIEIDKDHPIFHSFFEVDPAVVPQSYELGGPPMFFALFENNDPKGRMLVMTNYQNDLGEFWEYVELGYRPLPETNESYKVGINQFIYGITH